MRMTLASLRTVDNLCGHRLGLAAVQDRALDRASSRRHSPPAVLLAAVLAESVAVELRTERSKFPHARGPNARDRSVAKVKNLKEIPYFCGNLAGISACVFGNSFCMAVRPSQCHSLGVGHIPRKIRLGGLFWRSFLCGLASMWSDLPTLEPP